MRHLRLFFTCAIFIAFPLKCKLQPSFFDVGVFSTRFFPLPVEFSKASLNFHKNTGGRTTQNTQTQNTQTPKIPKVPKYSSPKYPKSKNTQNWTSHANWINFVEEPFSASLISRIEKFYASKGYVTIFCRKFFVSVPRHFVEQPFCAVFQKISDSEKVYG